MPSLTQIFLLLTFAAAVHVMWRRWVGADLRPVAVPYRRSRIRRARVAPVYQTDGGCASDF
jgi:hypothetical protein